MKLKIKIILFLMFLSLLISNVSSTYSRYVSQANGNITTDFAKWQIFVDNTNISENYDTSLTFTPNIDANENVASGKMAPGSTGYFDIEINAENVDVSFTYNITLSSVSTDVTDLRVTKYAILSDEDITNNNINTTDYNGVNIENNVIHNNPEDLKKFVVRVFFMWDDTENGTMSDIDDTKVGTKVANGEDIDFNLVANINFKQYI